MEGFNIQDIGTNESIASDSDHDLPHIKVSLMESSDVSSNTDFGDEQDENVPDNVNEAIVTTNANLPNLDIEVN